MKYVLGISAAVFFLLRGLFDEEEDAYISPSLLGKRGPSLIEALIREEEEDPELKNILASGTYFHRLIQEELGAQDVRAEVEVIADDVGVRGFVDALLPGNIPIEIKTISSKGLDNLSRPLPAHVSQINAYLHALKSRYGYIMYLDGQDISRRKIFPVGYEPSRLIADLSAVRTAIMTSSESMPADRVEWLTQHFQTSPGYFRGIRQSRGEAASFHTMKPHPEYNFPNGRIASTVQASEYRDLAVSAKSTEPTLGLTIHLHEKAKAGGARKYSSNTRVVNASRYDRQGA